MDSFPETYNDPKLFFLEGDLPGPLTVPNKSKSIKQTRHTTRPDINSNLG